MMSLVVVNKQADLNLLEGKEEEKIKEESSACGFCVALKYSLGKIVGLCHTDTAELISASTHIDIML